MRHEVDTHPSNGAKRVFLYPNDVESNIFQIRHVFHKQRFVGRIGLAGLDQETVEGIEAGEVCVGNLLTEDDEGWVVAAVEGLTPVADIQLEDRNISVFTVIKGFREMTVVPYPKTI